VLVPRARREAAAAVRWIAKENPVAAAKLRRTITDAAKLLGNRPFACRLESNLVGPHYCIWSLVSFPYILVYDPQPRPPEILRLAHTARDLGPLMADVVADGTPK
jgi:toxin ParE1/3/4